jgi:hypothetical protein
MEGDCPDPLWVDRPVSAGHSRCFALSYRGVPLNEMGLLLPRRESAVKAAAVSRDDSAVVARRAGGARWKSPARLRARWPANRVLEDLHEVVGFAGLPAVGASVVDRGREAIWLSRPPASHCGQ